jgi:hypothetical protein
MEMKEKQHNNGVTQRRWSHHGAPPLHISWLQDLEDFAFTLPGECDTSYTSCALRSVLLSAQRSLRHLTIDMALIHPGPLQMLYLVIPLHLMRTLSAKQRTSFSLALIITRNLIVR